MSKPRRLLERLRKAVPAFRTAAIDAGGVAGCGAVVHGIWQIYAPAGWIAAGLALLAASILLQRSRKAG